MHSKKRPNLNWEISREKKQIYSTSNFFCYAFIYLFLIISLVISISLLIFFIRPTFSSTSTSTSTSTIDPTLSTTSQTSQTSQTTTSVTPSSTATSQTTSTSSSTTTSFQLRWNSTGTTVAGITTTSGSTNDRLHYPQGILVDPLNNLYVADESNHRIQKWSLNYSNSSTIAGISGTPTNTFNGLNLPGDIAIDAIGNIYVADTYNYRILLFPPGQSNGTLFAGTGLAGSGNNEFNHPYGLSLDSNTNSLYVADYNNHRIMRYYLNSSNGTLVAGGNGGGSTATQLNLPRGIHFDATTNCIFIANYGSHNIVRWTLGATSWILVAGSATGTSGHDSMTLTYPTDVTVDSLRNIYVADKDNHRIQFFAPNQTNGTTILGTTWSSGSTPQQFNGPVSVVVDGQFNVFVSDRLNSRIQKFVLL